MEAIIAAILGPVLGGVITLGVWQLKKNTDKVEKGFDSLHECIHNVERKVDDMALEAAKTFVSREVLASHIDREEDWHDQHHTEVKELRAEFNDKVEKLSNDVAQIKETQWQMKMRMLDKD